MWDREIKRERRCVCVWDREANREGGCCGIERQTEIEGVCGIERYRERVCM